MTTLRADTNSKVAHTRVYISAIVKSKNEVAKDNECTKKCRDSSQNDDSCTDYHVSLCIGTHL